MHLLQQFTWLLGFLVGIGIGVTMLVLHATSLGTWLHRYIAEPSRRRLLLATVSFAVTFVVTRALAWAINHHVGPFGDVYIGGRHIHHLVWGILGLLAIGLCWVLGVGEGGSARSVHAARFLSLLYGACAALTLDEFALWLNLEDVYWAKEGRESIDAVVIFASVLLTILLAVPLVRGVWRELQSPR